jgi:hypothetical protein
MLSARDPNKLRKFVEITMVVRQKQTGMANGLREVRAGPQKLDSRLSYSRLAWEGVNDGTEAEVTFGDV